MKNKIFSVFFGVALFLFIISFSIGLPIYCRFFYYAQINALSLPQQTGYSFEQIKEAYDQVLNYLTLPNQTFSTGVLKFNQSGAEHFKDCKILFDINFFAPVELLRLLLKGKKLKKGASIVFVSSVGGISEFNVGNSIYGASKGALNSIMKQCALELAQKKIRVNSVNPGMVKTKLIHDGMSITEEQLAEDEKRYPMKRYGDPEDVSRGIIYLLSDAASWITGHPLVIDGGLSLV